MQEREINAEYALLPDEFNGQTEWIEMEEPKRRKKLSSALLCSAVFLLILSLTVMPQFLHSGAVPPEAVIPETGQEAETNVTEPIISAEEGPDYEILGLWNFEEEYYAFSDDGSGFYFSGQFFNPVTWKEDGKDYSYSGGGVIRLEEMDVTVEHSLNTTRKGEGGLYLQSYVTGKQELFVPVASMNLPLDVYELFSEPVGDRIKGYWMLEEELDPYPSLWPLYLDLADGNKGMMHTESYNGVSKFESFTYSFGEEMPEEIRMKSLEGEKFTFEFVDEGWTASFDAAEIVAYYFVDPEGEGLLVYGFHGASILRKETDY